MMSISRAAPALARNIWSARPIPIAGPSRCRAIHTLPVARASLASSVRVPTPESDVIEFDAEHQQDLASAKEQLDEAFTQRAAILHRAPMGPLDPILLPLSSLASANPSAADGSGMAIALPRDIFSERIRRDILHRCVVWFRSAMRQGTHRTKGRSEVAYSGRKLRPQKGSGKARLGDASNPIIRGGAHAFPKRNRNYTQLLPRKIRAMGMRIALTMKLEMGLLRCVKNLNEGGWTKTKEAMMALHGSASSETSIGFDSGKADSKALSILFVYPHTKPASDVKSFALPLRNVPGVEIMSTDEVQVYHILKHRWLVLEAGAVDILALQKGQPRFSEDVPEWETTDLAVGIEEAQSTRLRGRRVNRPRRWLVHRWRKVRGAKSMRKVFGMRQATAVERESKMTWDKIAKLGVHPVTPDMVTMAIASKYVRDDRRIRKIVP
ncbi:ribosomal protein L4/L1 family-domain-containing protein [Kockovaella imperatae]|uniref:Large ribosomal subunit protein uL4m n=1 Tax=Kockovaella imperatae TaxID=4999 RepID=A0A1Y1UPH0_9TREE|nr:ribosomal protein L4/L1 family-domain-containing protein [Kockovaella imperatae]ORX39948.1 ribosomal protein L4/L1 family-domain-containing protein [Kockovaella imperatae]